ncbi:hypothetical protein AVEN_200347-1 [Araneus ventricosus]|uniref:Uncharacterized protein n=1 Tax=Araneus ventricosus TaxID=182803 RepID=A0A4Y2HXT3_ARAVE|nr:hypothetical protein AVEN_154145-1 [Araneus ventricosus]GBM70340.1 hypothetical protein AVEN_200347-1 [Araneus ventricosus]
MKYFSQSANHRSFNLAFYHAVSGKRHQNILLFYITPWVSKSLFHRHTNTSKQALEKSASRLWRHAKTDGRKCRPLRCSFQKNENHWVRGRGCRVGIPVTPIGCEQAWPL